MSGPVRTTPEAEAQIRDVDVWWRTHRPSSPDLFLEELIAAIDIIGDAPHVGRLYRLSPVPGTRRALLRETRYHVYYVPGADEITVLAIWHARRGVGPPLRAR